MLAKLGEAAKNWTTARWQRSIAAKKEECEALRIDEHERQPTILAHIAIAHRQNYDEALRIDESQPAILADVAIEQGQRCGKDW